MSNSSLFFRKLLVDERVHFLFGEVLNNIVDIHVGKLVQAQELNDTKANFKSYIRKTDETLTRAIRTCRLANSFWNDAVINCFERPVMAGITPLINNPMQRTTVIRPAPGNELEFSYRSDPQNTRQFLEDFRTTRKNPFLGRHVRFDVGIGTNDYLNVFLNDVTEIISIFGKHIWYVTFTFCVSPGNVAFIVEAYLKLVEWLNLTPNLVFLCVQLNAHEARKLINRFILQHPLPKLNFLKLLEVHELTGGILEELISTNYSIPFIRINSNHDFNQPICSLLPNLTGIGLRYTGVKPINQLNCVGPNCKLEMLHIHQEYQNFDVNENFRLINQYYSGTLADLTLDLTYPKDFRKMIQDSRLWQLNLPKLVRISLRIYGLYFLDFILPLQNLKTLEVMIISDDHVEDYETLKAQVMSEQTIEFFGFELRLNKSNIWEKLKNLQRVKLIFGGHFGHPVTCYEYNKCHLPLTMLG